MKKPLIGITLDSEKPSQYSKFPWYAIRYNYLNSIFEYGGIPFPLFHNNRLIKDISNELDGLIITGGNFDIDPKLYGKESLGSRQLKNLRTEFLLDYVYSKHYKSGINFGLVQSIKMLTFNFGYSQFSNLRTTLSSGFKITLNQKYNLLYSLLSIQNSNLGIAHYFGIEISL